MKSPIRSIAPIGAALTSAVFMLALAANALAEPGTPVITDATTPPKPAPYSLPFQLRPIGAATAVRLDTSLAFYDNPTTHTSGTTTVPILLASYKVNEHFAPLVRLGVVSNSPPSGPSGFGFLNPILGGIFAINPRDVFKVSLFLGVSVPVGSGGGNSPDPAQKAARNSGVFARSAMDNAMFAVDDLTIFPGVDVAFVKAGFTAQAEVTVFQLTRVRGATDDKDPSRTNLTSGVHVGYFLAPFISVAAELRYQRWLSTPKQIAADTTDTLRDNTTIAFGPRAHFKLGDAIWFRPAVSLALPLDDPMKKASYKILQLDLPFTF